MAGEGGNFYLSKELFPGSQALRSASEDVEEEIDRLIVQ